jgi:hypothetical protein
MSRQCKVALLSRRASGLTGIGAAGDAPEADLAYGVGVSRVSPPSSYDERMALANFFATTQLRRASYSAVANRGLLAQSSVVTGPRCLILTAISWGAHPNPIGGTEVHPTTMLSPTINSKPPMERMASAAICLSWVPVRPLANSRRMVVVQFPGLSIQPSSTFNDPRALLFRTPQNHSILIAPDS